MFRFPQRRSVRPIRIVRMGKFGGWGGWTQSRFLLLVLKLWNYSVQRESLEFSDIRESVLHETGAIRLSRWLPESISRVAHGFHVVFQRVALYFMLSRRSVTYLSCWLLYYYYHYYCCCCYYYSYYSHKCVYALIFTIIDIFSRFIKGGCSGNRV